MKIVDPVNNKKKRKVVNLLNNRTLIIGFSNCGKTYLMNHILLRKHEQIYVITKSLNQYPNIKSSNIRRNSTIRKLRKQHCCF